VAVGACVGRGDDIAIGVPYVGQRGPAQLSRPPATRDQQQVVHAGPGVAVGVCEPADVFGNPGVRAVEDFLSHQAVSTPRWVRWCAGVSISSISATAKSAYEMRLVASAIAVR